MKYHAWLTLLLWVGMGVAVGRAANEEIFSGPQVGEKLTPFAMRGVLGDLEGKTVDLVTEADGKPIVLFFVHEVTRPSIGLMRTIMDYAARRKADGLHAGVVILSDDPTASEAWLKRASRALPLQVPIGISVDGQEGPGAYGLNRNVSLTVLVGNENQVTANFALVQPSLQADAIPIASQLVEVLGGGKVPTLEELGGPRYQAQPRNVREDPEVANRLRRLIQKTATAEDVERVARELEAYVEEKPAVRGQLGDIARRIVASDKLENYGTAAAQEYLKKWAREFPGEKRTPR